jgi:Domain of unknown function (DUF1814).
MAEVRQLLRAKARERGVRLDILEKDYALSYLLAAISEIPAFDAIVLKGGNCSVLHQNCCVCHCEERSLRRSNPQAVKLA